jgi:tetratricopeptide (TPR) repeat protein
MHLIPFVSGAADPGLGIEKLGLEASGSSPWDVRGRARAMEEVSGFHLLEGDTVAAADMLSQAYDMRPNPHYLGTSGYYYMRGERHDRAIEQFERLVADDPLDVEANLSLGILHAYRGETERARRYLLVAYGDTSLHFPEPIIHAKTDWEDMPEGPERAAIVRERTNLRAYAIDIFVRGDEAVSRGLLDLAEEQYRAALDAYPYWGRMQYEVHCRVGTLYAVKGRFREAAYELLLGLNSFRDYKLCTFMINGVGYGQARLRGPAPQPFQPAD